MYRSVKQTQPKNNNSVLTIICLLLAFAGVMYGTAQREQLQMERYAINNNCEWKATGTLYGDNRDYICIKKAS